MVCNAYYQSWDRAICNVNDVNAMTCRPNIDHCLLESGFASQHHPQNLGVTLHIKWAKYWCQLLTDFQIRKYIIISFQITVNIQFQRAVIWEQCTWWCLKNSLQVTSCHGFSDTNSTKRVILKLFWMFFDAHDESLISPSLALLPYSYRCFPGKTVVEWSICVSYIKRYNYF